MLLASLALFQSIPVYHTHMPVFKGFIRKNMGMTVNHLFRNIVYNILCREKALFFGNAGMDDDLIQDVA